MKEPILSQSLKDNQAAIANLILNNINTNAEDDRTEKLQYLGKQIAEAIQSENFGKAIELLMELKDFNQGISWHVISNPYTGKDMLVRDARNCHDPNDCNEPYLIMAINYVRATKALLPADKYAENKSYIELLIRNFYIKGINTSEKNILLKDFARFNTVITNLIAINLNIPFDEAYKRLNAAKDFVNLEEPSKDIVTVFHLKDSNAENITAFQADFPRCELTPEIKEEYLHLERNKWYQILPHWEQDLVKKYRPNILAERCVLPTQLRTVPLVGLRNQYETFCGLFSQNEPLITFHGFHSGTLIAFGKDLKENFRISELNAKQLQKLSGAKNLSVLTLNSRTNPKGNDQDIVKYTGDIAKNLGLLHTNLPQNWLRLFETNKCDGVNHLLELVAIHLVPVLHNYLAEIDTDLFDDLVACLKNEISSLIDPIEFNQKLSDELSAIFTSHRDKFENKNFVKIYEIINMSLYIHSFIQKNAGINDPSNRNLTLGCLTNLFAFELENILEVAINSSCESGKDRTGILMFKIALSSFNKALFNSFLMDLTSVQVHHLYLIQENTKKMAAAGHLQFLAGCQGGTCGAFGIKSDSKGALPAEFDGDTRVFLIQKTASFNKKISLADDKNVVYFPIGNTDPLDQRSATIHVLTLQEKKLTQNMKENKPSGLISFFFNSESTSVKQASLLASTIRKLNELPENCTLKNILDVVKEAESQIKSTERTFFGKDPTIELLQNIEGNLQLVIDNSVSQGMESQSRHSV
jgi:hypothetical protein